MYIDTGHYTKNGKRYTRTLLRTSYREGGKVKHRTIGSLNKCLPQEIEAIKMALKYKENLSQLHSIEDIEIEQGKSIGAVYALKELAVRTGVADALGRGVEAQRALWQVLARIITQGSRCSASRLTKTHESSLVGIDRVSDDQLYKNLDWLEANQDKIEKRLWHKSKDKSSQLYLYDVTSSYLEGSCNEYAEYGYNRDQKRSKKQIVIGLLTDEHGEPISIKVFAGNTQDPKTFSDQITRMKNQFKAKGVTMVGDRGMIKSKQIEGLPEDYAYITAITKPQIETLIKEKVIQLELFTSEIAEIEHDGVRYIMRCNPWRKDEIRASRQSKLAVIIDLVKAQNEYLLQHKKAKVVTVVEKIKAKINKLRVADIITLDIDIQDKTRTLSISIDSDTQAEIEQLDGCYCIKTDVAPEVAAAEILHDRYKSLKFVERAFRSMKQSYLEIRPIYVRKAGRTEGHALVVMLAYRILRVLEAAWKDMNITTKEGIASLSMICVTKLTLLGKGAAYKIPQPSQQNKVLLDAVNIQLPSLASPQMIVPTKLVPQSHA